MMSSPKWFGGHWAPPCEPILALLVNRLKPKLLNRTTGHQVGGSVPPMQTALVAAMSDGIARIPRLFRQAKVKEYLHTARRANEFQRFCRSFPNLWLEESRALLLEHRLLKLIAGQLHAKANIPRQFTAYFEPINEIRFGSKFGMRGELHLLALNFVRRRR